MYFAWVLSGTLAIRNLCDEDGQGGGGRDCGDGLDAGADQRRVVNENALNLSSR